MSTNQAPPGAVPYVKIKSYSKLHVETFGKVIRKNCKLNTNKLVAAVRRQFTATEDEVIQSIEELRADGTLFLLPNGKFRYDSYDSH